VDRHDDDGTALGIGCRRRNRPSPPRSRRQDGGRDHAARWRSRNRAQLMRTMPAPDLIMKRDGAACGSDERGACDHAQVGAPARKRYTVATARRERAAKLSSRAECSADGPLAILPSGAERRPARLKRGTGRRIRPCKKRRFIATRREGLAPRTRSIQRRSILDTAGSAAIPWLEPRPADTRRTRFLSLSNIGMLSIGS
jgi:hypothetical protein